MASKILYCPIDFVASDSRAATFGIDLSHDLAEAQVAIQKQKLPIHLALKTTLIEKARHGWGVSEEGVDYFNKGVETLRKAGIDYWVETWPSGPTRSMYGVLFDAGAAVAFNAISTGDLDQFPPHSNLERMLELWTQVAENNLLMGMGSRNLPYVRLSFNKENAHLRRIFEGVMNLAVRHAAVASGKDILEKTSQAADNQYQRTGDFITGVYLFNPQHSHAGDLVDELDSTAREKGFFGFEDEYALAINAARLGDIGVSPFVTARNLFDEVGVREEREAIMNKQIQSPLAKLAGTAADLHIVGGIQEARRELADFYTPEQLNEVLSYMNGVLNETDQ